MRFFKELLRKREQIYTESELLSKLQDLVGGSVKSNVSPSEMCALAVGAILRMAHLLGSRLRVRAKKAYALTNFCQF